MFERGRLQVIYCQRGRAWRLAAPRTTYLFTELSPGMPSDRLPDTQARQKTYTLLSAALSTLVVLVIVEVLVRFFLPYETPDTFRKNSLEYMPSIFARHLLRPNQHVNVDKDRRRASADQRPDRVFRIDEHGFRGKSFVLPKPSGTRRVVVLGGSAVFDIYATEGRDWPTLA